MLPLCVVLSQLLCYHLLVHWICNKKELEKRSQTHPSLIQGVKNPDILIWDKIFQVEFYLLSHRSIPDTNFISRIFQLQIDPRDCVSKVLCYWEVKSNIVCEVTVLIWVGELGSPWWNPGGFTGKLVCSDCFLSYSVMPHGTFWLCYQEYYQEHYRGQINAAHPNLKCEPPEPWAKGHLFSLSHGDI